MITLSDRNRLKDAIRNIPDFPATGIQFKDITTAVRQQDLFRKIVDDIARHHGPMGITRVVAIESRGFIAGGALAYRLGAGFVPVRKPGKLPGEKYTVTYDLEYGQDSLEIHKDALHHDDVVLLHDDLLATGGTALATIQLLHRFNIRRIYASFIIELDFLQGIRKLTPHAAVYSLIHY